MGHSIDREKVMTWLEICGKNRGCSGNCPYGDGSAQCEDLLCREDLMSDALALLKEQRAIEPDVDVINEIDRLYRCPKCHKHFLYRKQKYCDQCGQEVKWE